MIFAKGESYGVFVHALAMRSNDALLASSFQRLSISSSASIAIVESIARGVLQDIELDTRLLARRHSSPYTSSRGCTSEPCDSLESA